MSTIKANGEPSTSWESFVGLWERANLIRAFFWHQRFVDEKVLLTHFLARLRRFFAVDFCYCALCSFDQRRMEAGQPGAGLLKLPENLSHRCMDLVANASAPITWHNDVSAEFGYRSTVVVPLTPPAGRSFGFLMLGHGRRRSYSSQELFLLQSLAGEFSWIVRDLGARAQRQGELVTVSHDVKNVLQVILGNAALIQRKLADGLPQSESKKYLQSIEIGVQQITDRMNALSGLAEASAASATRNESVRLTVGREEDDVEVIVKGMESNRVADRLRSLFEPASRLEGARDKSVGGLTQVRKYLDNAGGDGYLKSCPEEDAEFIVRVPMESSLKSGRAKFRS